MIWVVGIVIALVVFKDRLPGGLGAAVDSVLGAAGAGTNAITNGQTFTQNPMVIMGAGSQIDTSGASNSAPNMAPGNVPVRAPGFAGSNFAPLRAQAAATFLGPPPQTSINPGWLASGGGFMNRPTGGIHL